MKKIKEQSPVLKRRDFLLALFAFPLLAYTQFPARKNSVFSMDPDGDNDFIIVNGWVLLKQDVTESEV